MEQVVAPACTDDDGDALSFAKQSEPAHGTLTDSGGVLRYTAAPVYDGTDSFTYRASDGHGGQSGIGTVTVNVSHTNHAPACTGGPFAYVVESGAVLALPDPSCTDADGETLSYEIVTPPAHGTLGDPGAGGGRTYTPDPGFAGDDSFTFRASDGVDESGLQTVTITVTPPPNDPPACSDATRRLAPDAPATIQLACTDPDGDPVTLETVAGPAHGTLGAIDQGTDQVVYTPDPGYTGADSFTYRATDGTLAGPAATVSIVVTGAPACQDVARTTRVDTAVSVPLTCTDPDGDALTLSIVAGPSKGSLDGMSGGAVTYTPDAGESGADSFTYRASDGTASRRPATVSITSRGRRAAMTSRAPPRSAPGVGAAGLHRSGRRRADAVDRGRAGEGLAGRDLRRLGDLHAGRRQVRRRLVHATGRATAPSSRCRRRCRSRSRARRAATTCRADGGWRAGVGAAVLHGSGRRRADAVDRRRPVEGLARHDRRRRGDLHAGRGRVRRRLLHLRRDRRHGRLGPATVSITITRAADAATTCRGRRRSASRSRCRCPARIPTVTR